MRTPNAARMILYPSPIKTTRLGWRGRGEGMLQITVFLEYRKDKNLKRRHLSRTLCVSELIRDILKTEMLN